jgi:hypothetical protein
MAIKFFSAPWYLLLAVLRHSNKVAKDPAQSSMEKEKPPEGGFIGLAQIN